MPLHTHSSHQRNSGFSLVEIMVGMVIGLLSMIVILQIFSMFEGQKRSTTGGDDAQNGGIIALNQLQNEISQAGYGINTPKLIGCPLITSRISLPAITPVIINPKKGTIIAPIGGLNPLISAIPADANTDSFLVTYGNSNAVSEGTLITGADTVNNNYSILGGAAASGVAAVGVGGRGFQIGDNVLSDDGSRGAGCKAIYMTQVNGINGVNVPVIQIPATFTFTQTTAAADRPTLYNLGPTPHMLAYAVINNTLSMCDFEGSSPQICNAAATWTQLASDIVSMKVECLAPTGIRLAIVARNSKYNPSIVTSAALANIPTWSGTSPIVTVGNALGADANPANWGHYRYKTFETIIPIRNAIWAGAPGC